MSHNYDDMCIITDYASDYWRLDQDRDCLVNKAKEAATSTAGGVSVDLLPAANNDGSTHYVAASSEYTTMVYAQLQNGITTGATDLSVECWIRQATDQSATDVIGVAQKPGCFGIYLAYGKPTFFTQLSGSGRVNCGASTAISQNTNYHLVGTYNSSTGDLKLYVNGSLVNTVNTSTGNAIDQTSGINFTVGSWDTSVLFFNGNISNVAIYDGTVLNSTQVSAHHSYSG